MPRGATATMPDLKFGKAQPVGHFGLLVWLLGSSLVESHPLRQLNGNTLVKRRYNVRVKFLILIERPSSKPMNRAQAVQQKRNEILSAAARNGAYNVRLFGSVARGDATETSDIDFLVDMQPGRSLLDVAGLLIDLEKLLGCKVDVVTTKGLKKSIKDDILNEARVL